MWISPHKVRMSNWNCGSEWFSNWMFEYLFMTRHLNFYLVSKNSEGSYLKGSFLKLKCVIGTHLGWVLLLVLLPFYLKCSILYSVLWFVMDFFLMFMFFQVQLYNCFLWKCLGGKRTFRKVFQEAFNYLCFLCDNLFCLNLCSWYFNWKCSLDTH